MKKILFSAMLSTFALLASPAMSWAGFSVTVSDGKNTKTLETNGQSLSGTYAFNYSNGSILWFTVTASTNSPGVGGVGTVTNQTISFLKGGTGTLAAQSITIVSNSTGFNLGGSGGTVTTNFSSGILQGSAYGTSNINGTAVAGSGLNLTDSNQFKTSTVQTSFDSTPFSFGNTMKIDLKRGSTNTSLATVKIQSTVESNVLTAPTPSALILAALGVPAFGLVRRWSRKSSIAVEASVAA